MSGLRLIPVTAEAPLDAWVAIYNRVWTLRPRTAAATEHHWTQAPECLGLLALRDERHVGCGFVEGEAHFVPTSTLAYAEALVLPEARGHGIGTELYRRLSAWAAARGLTGLDVLTSAADPAGGRFWSRRGFAEVGRNRELVLELEDAPFELPGPPEGIALATLAGRADLVDAMYEVAREAYGDMPGPEPAGFASLEEWRRHEIERPGLEPEGCTLALDGARVVGYSTIARDENRPWVGRSVITGVARDWRGRGVASALKGAQIAWAACAGLRRLETENEAQNVGMLRVNARLGYRARPDAVWLRGPLA